MIPNRDHVEVQTIGDMKTASGSIAMTPEMFEIISSKIYTDKPMAIVREICCNARDANILTGTDKGIIVGLPNGMTPYLEIRDFGPGMSDEKITGDFMNWGNSDKTDSNLMIGAMGIGSKSPLSYTNSFLITSYHGGYKTVWNLYLNNGLPDIAMMSKQESQEDTGISIKVAVSHNDFRCFIDAAETFLKYFPEKSNVIGANVDLRTDILDEQEDYVIYNPGRINHYGIEVKAEMGGVVYNLPSSSVKPLQGVLPSKSICHLKFNIGDLTVTASRENIELKEVSKLAIKTKVEAVLDKLHANIQKNIDAATNMIDVWEVLDKFRMIKTFNGQYTLAKKFTRNGRELGRFVSDSSLFKFRAEYSGSGGRVHLKLRALIDNKRDNKLIFIVTDRKLGAIKLCKHLNTKHRVVDNKEYLYLIVEPDQKDSYVNLFGDSVEFWSAAEVYPKYITKSSNTNRTVKTSGLMDSRGVMISELKDNQEGIYIPLNKDDCLVAGLTTLNKETIINFLRPIAGGNRVSQPIPGIYLCRKGGIKSLAKTKLRCATINDFKKLLTFVLPEDQINNLVKRGVTIPSIFGCNWLRYNKDVGELSDLIKAQLPVTVDVVNGALPLDHPVLNNGSMGMVIDLLYPDINERTRNLRSTVEAEVQVLEDRYPLLRELRWSMTQSQTVIDEATLYIKMKNHLYLKNRGV